MSRHKRFRFKGATPELVAKALLQPPPLVWGPIPQCRPAAKAEARIEPIPAKSARAWNLDSAPSRQSNLREQSS